MHIIVPATRQAVQLRNKCISSRTAKLETLRDFFPQELTSPQWKSHYYTNGRNNERCVYNNSNIYTVFIISLVTHCHWCILIGQYLIMSLNKTH